MAKASFLLAVLCGLASLSASLADPSMYGAAPPAKYPAPATYPAPPKYEAPTTTTTKYEAPTTTTTKYEAPTTTTTKYEEKKEEYPMKMEYKKEEYPAPMKMKYGGKKYKRSIEEDSKEAKTEDEPIKTEDEPIKLTRKVVQTVRDAVIQDLVSMIGETVGDDDAMDFDKGEQEDEEEQSDEDLDLMTPEMDSAMEDDIADDKMDTFADPMMMARIRILIKKRIQAKMCLCKCDDKRRRPSMFLPTPIIKRRRYRPTTRPVPTRLPPRMKCFWKRVCF